MKVFLPKWVKKSGSFVIVTHKEQGKDKPVVQEMHWIRDLDEAMKKYNELKKED